MQIPPVDDPDSANQLSELALFNLNLNNLDQLSGLFFGIGLNFLFLATSETVRTVLLEEDPSLPVAIDAQLNYEIAKKLANTNWMYLLANIVLYYTATERLNQIENSLEPDRPSTQDRIQGREMVIAGDTLKILGYILSANGFERIADSSSREVQETTPP
jgi:hypothetical protein